MNAIEAETKFLVPDSNVWFGMGTTAEKKERGAMGQRLAEVRKNAGLTQVHVAAALGVPQQTVAYWECHAKAPRADVLPRLAELYGVSVEQLLGTKPSNKKPGPKSRLEDRFERVAALPKRQQDRVLSVIDALLAEA